MDGFRRGGEASEDRPASGERGRRAAGRGGACRTRCGARLASRCPATAAMSASSLPRAAPVSACGRPAGRSRASGGGAGARRAVHPSQSQRKCLR